VAGVPRLRRCDWFVANLDSDAPHDDGGAARAARIESAVARFKTQGAVTGSGSEYALVDGTKLGILLWEASDAAHAELPSTQTLERLVCASLRAVHPARAAAVEQWLRARVAEGSPSLGAKAFAWSHMAGWYSEHGCDDFYQQLWRDDPVVSALQTRLAERGAWDLVQKIVS
jgi:hypothetical protein